MKSLTALKAIFIFSMVNLIAYHLPLLTYALNNLDFMNVQSLMTLLTLLLIGFVVSIVALSFLYLVSHHLIKPFCILVVCINSIAFYFIYTYQIVLDKSMIGNILNTDLGEASSYFHPKLVGFFVCLGLIPSYLLWKTKLEPASRGKVLVCVCITLIMSGGWLYATSSCWLWIDKHAKKVGSLILPWSYVFNLARFGQAQRRFDQPQLLLPLATSSSGQKTVVVLVIGESARAASFSLYGYKNTTNPEMALLDVQALPNVHACSTYTTASLRCILSHTDSSSEIATTYEPLPSYLHRHGVDVIWRTNNWGEPKVDVDEYIKGDQLRQNCEADSCNYDEVLLTGLLERIKNSKKNKVFVILHQSGSHGPAYSTKYPPQFEKFTPVCRSVELHQCTQQELNNAYDNTIVYTDHFLAQVIQGLSSIEDRASMLMYISDHGESLGEKGLYLHGTPVLIAPSEQTKVPFIFWASTLFKNKFNLKDRPLQKASGYSQHNIFHTVMGAFDMTSTIYDESLNILQPSNTASH